MLSGGVPVAYGRQVARRWVLRERTALPGFTGAFFVGSVTRLAPTATLPFTSDVDVKVVVDVSEPPEKIGKFLVDGVLLDVSFLSADRLRSTEQVLGDCVLAGSVRSSERIADPTGLLETAQAAVSEAFARRPWVRRRCTHARDRVLDRLRGLRRDDPLPDQVIAWVFATGAMTHLLLVAGLRDVTVRRCYVAVRELLDERGRPDVHETLLELLGCRSMTPRRVEHHLGALARAFDVAAAVADAPFVFRSDISRAARRVAVDGGRELIARGDHREAVFWMVATYAKALKILAYGAEPATRDAAEVGLRELLADLGIWRSPTWRGACGGSRTLCRRSGRSRRTSSRRPPRCTDTARSHGGCGWLPRATRRDARAATFVTCRTPACAPRTTPAPIPCRSGSPASAMSPAPGRSPTVHSACGGW